MRARNANASIVGGGGGATVATEADDVDDEEVEVDGGGADVAVVDDDAVLDAHCELMSVEICCCGCDGAVDGAWP